MTSMSRILVLPVVLHRTPGPYLDVLKSAGFEISYPEPDADLSTPAKLLPFLDGVSGVLAGMEPFTREVLAQSKLRAIARMGVGYDAIDVAAATERGIPVTITPGTNEVSVAEHTMALLLGVLRGFPLRDQLVRKGDWQRRKMPRLEGKTLGLVGLGRIGKALVPRARAFGVRILAYDPKPDQAFAESTGVRLCGLDELLRESDIVSLHAPCTPETENLINRKTLAAMKRGSVLINTARGGLVDEGALAESLANGHLFGAGLDVFKVEPLPLDSPLLRFPNVLLCTHMGGLDEESEVAMSRLAAQCLADLYQGKWPAECIVNPAVGPNWKW